MMHALYNRLRIETGMKLAKDAVEHAVRRRMREAGEDDPNLYALHALGDSQELSALIDQIVVPETWFFRDVDAFAAATAFVAGQIRKGRRPVRLLSIPCATGEEPYSMAIALAEAGIARDDVVIEAIDVSRGAIKRAQRGLYHRNAFRTKDLAFRERYFRRTEQGEGYQLREDILDAVSFRCANLLTLKQEAQGAHTEQFDIIFCRNLLIYFDEATQRNAAAKLRSLLRDDGLLLSGYAETNAFVQHGFAAAPFPKAFALIKASKADASAPSIAVDSPPIAVKRKERKHSLPQTLDSRPQPMPRVAPSTALASSLKADSKAELQTGLLQAREAADAGNLQEAERIYRQCLQSAPDCAEAYFMLGLLLERQSDAGAAAEHLRRAVYLAPDHYDALCHLALLAEQDGDAASAERYRQRAARVFERRSAMRDKS
ncbi:CheR family methyltransferase [Noviherbaspirillum malthae]|uniref:CheR family methyltransferase n=1 Tax=Noviherbaspirillum malthae TaxID=1260987 RepID=UPI00188EDAA1|nr:CheR family methyltransferase [Noviherbaspirillum malthae]